MTFRDERDAVRARAEALARELAEKEAQIEALHAQLAHEAAALREETSAAAEREPDTRAAEALESLKRQRTRHAEREAATRSVGSTPHSARSFPTLRRIRRASGSCPTALRCSVLGSKADEAQVLQKEREEDRRRLASLSVFGQIELWKAAVALAGPTFLASVYLAPSWQGFPVLIPTCVVLGLLAVQYGGRWYARHRWQEEERWAKSLPYVLSGYPEALAKAPASTITRLHQLDGDEHRILQLTLELATEALPSDLGAILKGFDPELTNEHPLKEKPFALREPDAGNVFYRPSPTTPSPDTASQVRDHNRAVHAWVRRLDREVLRPLHVRHRLARVELRLR